MDVGGRRQFGAILISRQARRPCRKEAWVKQAERAIRYLKSRGMGVVSSVGQSTWDLVTSLAAVEKLPVRLVLPDSPRKLFSDCANECVRQFDLSPDIVKFIPAPTPISRIKSDRLSDRDALVTELADLLLPVSIRAGGSMENLTQQAAARGKAVHREFETEYTARRESLKYSVDIGRLSQQIRGVGSSYLIHWTRTANHQWPGERTVDYYRDVISSEQHCRTAFDALKRILSERCLRSSARHMRKGYSAVAFSRLSPVDVLPLMRWRSRFGEMSFEPYGIGIRLEPALEARISPVAYISKRSSIGATPWLCQTIGQKTDWRQEQEYRHLGDLDLRSFDPADLLALTLYPHEAEEMTSLFGVSAVSFY